MAENPEARLAAAAGALVAHTAVDWLPTVLAAARRISARST